MEELVEKKGFTEIPIDEIVSNMELLVDLYIYLSDVKFVRIARAGDTLSPERLSTYKENGVTCFLIKTEDYKSYLEVGLTAADLIITNPETPLTEKQDALTKIAANVFVEIENMDFGKKIYTHSKQLANSAISFCMNKPDLAAILKQFAELNSGTLYAHSVAVCTISIIIGLEHGWKGKSTLEKLSLGGLLHDIGLKGIPPGLRNKSRALMTFEEKLEYESHSFLGMEILRTLPEVPDDIISVAFQHHEQGMGFGFPRHLKQFFINPYARIEGLANEFCNLTMPHLSPGPLRAPIEAIHFIENVLGQPYWQPAFKALQRLIEKNKV